ncbi:sugar transport protein 5-like, partial [Telopea speciosissima]|uniref:sugar transport protein 5-like n=1 Tax=Telopea speciosissima TaxID=54955 RepID=UPI001CC507D4
NVIAFYASVLFQSVGFGSDAALMASIRLGMVNLSSIFMSAGLVDRYGRRVLFLQGGTQMFLCQVVVASVPGTQIGVSGNETLSKDYAVLPLMLICAYAAGFGWSWGPLSWLIRSEIFPLKIRPTSQSISVAVNFATTFVLALTFLTILCHFKYGIFLFYSGWIAIMTVFIAFFLPETKGVPLESMHTVWENHWYWKRFVKRKSAAMTLPRQMD